jgi:NosR/NirI family nitrous oxide reductase transcriptional regulator
MKRLVVLTLLLVVMIPVVGHGSQWKFFEHRYKYKLSDVLRADSFVKKDGYWEGYKDNRLVGYVFLSKGWTEKLVGYSGKHMETLIGIDTEGIITGVKLVFHSEPIVLIGLKDKNYLEFLKQYSGKDLRMNLSVGKQISLDAITGATVTAVVQNAIILESARKVAIRTGMLKYAKRQKRKISKKYTPLSWKELLDSGAIKNIVVSSRDLGIQGEDIYLDLYFGILSPPSIGRNILGEKLYNETMKSLKEGESALFIFSRGEGSFKGAGFARGGIFDRFNISQGESVHVIRDIDYRQVSHILAKGAPQMKEGGIFVLRAADFEETQPFKFNLIIPYRVKGRKEFKSFSEEYKIPERFLK